MDSSIGNNRWSLSGTTALVTGGTKGIGRAIVEELAGLGVTVYTCSRNEAELDKCLRKWESLKFSVIGSVCDVSSRVELEKLMEKVSSTFQGKLNILINNAGTFIQKPTNDCTLEDYSFLMATNFESVFHLSQLAHPLLKASSAGSIIHISSIAGLVSLKECSIYAATKGAINQLTKNLACEWAKDNIRTNCIAPGVIRTPLVEPLCELTSRILSNEDGDSRMILQETRTESLLEGNCIEPSVQVMEIITEKPSNDQLCEPTNRILSNQDCD